LSQLHCVYLAEERNLRVISPWMKKKRKLLSRHYAYVQFTYDSFFLFVVPFSCFNSFIYSFFISFSFFNYIYKWTDYWLGLNKSMSTLWRRDSLQISSPLTHSTLIAIHLHLKQRLNCRYMYVIKKGGGSG
jgi:hypothetical protein